MKKYIAIAVLWASLTGCTYIDVILNADHVFSIAYDYSEAFIDMDEDEPCREPEYQESN